jgi:hypothetical protein
MDFWIVDFIFWLVEIRVNSQIPNAKHIHVQKSDKGVKARTHELYHVGLHTVIGWIWMQLWVRVIIDVDM